MKYELYLKSRNGMYDAIGIFDGENFVVKKNSKIKVLSNSKYEKNKTAEIYRNDDKYVKNGILIKDVEFKSPSTAAQFVVNQSINGYKAWKNKEGICLKEIIK